MDLGVFDALLGFCGDGSGQLDLFWPSARLEQVQPGPPFLQFGLGFADFGEIITVEEAGNALALFDRVAFLEIDLLDKPLDFRADISMAQWQHCKGSGNPQFGANDEQGSNASTQNAKPDEALEPLDYCWHGIGLCEGGSEQILERPLKNANQENRKRKKSPPLV